MASNSKKKIIPVLAAFFVMGFCDIVGISSDYMQTSFWLVFYDDRVCTFYGIYLVSLFGNSDWK